MDDVERTTAHRGQAIETALNDERLFHEINLLRLEGYYFCLDPKEATRRRDDRYEFSETIKNPKREIHKRPVVILAHARYGYPSTLAYRVLQAIVKKLGDYGYPVPNTVYFSQRELVRMIGRKSHGGRDQQDLHKAMKQLQHTEISCFFYDKDHDEWQNVSFQILTTAAFSGKRNRITECYVEVHRLIVDSLNRRHTLCLNYTRLETLEPIGMALYKRLFYHFSNLYSIKKERGFSFRKDYADICTAWLGGLKVLRYKSKVLNEQLGRHLRSLKKIGLITKYAIEKNAQGNGFNLVFYPGAGFFDDYGRFYEKQLQTEMQFRKAAEREMREQPLALVSYFYAQLYPSHETDSMVFSTKETDLARSLLETYTAKDVKDLVDYALAEARRTHFEIRSFGGVRIYLSSWLAERTQKASRVASERQRATEDLDKRLRDRYERFKSETIEAYKATLSSEELSAIEETIQEQLHADGVDVIALGFMLRVKTDAALAKQCGIPSYDEWKERLAP